MNKDETKEAIEVMQAYVDGAEIEFKHTDSWRTLPPFGWGWNWVECSYRIKKAPRTFWIAGDGLEVLTEKQYIENFCRDPRYFKVQEVLD